MKILVSLMAALAAVSAFAQEHDHVAMVKAYLAANSVHGPVIPQPETIQPTAVKTFNIVAKSFEFDITPATFAVNQGDVVTLNISVPANDPSLVHKHGFLMDTYVENAVSISNGQTKTITFTATTVGHFQFACSESSCGTGHFDMAGVFFVNAAQSAPPAVSSVDPTGGTTAGGTVVTINGANFQSNATVKFGGVAATNVNVTSSTTIVATAPAHAAGAVDIVVTNPDSQVGTLTGGFTYATPGPTVAAISPPTGPTSGNTPITVNGSNFQSGATVTIGGAPALNVTVVDPNTITALTPLGPTNEQVAVKKDVVVTNPDHSPAGTLASAFQYTRPPLAVALVTPSFAPPAGGTKISIGGAGFTNALPVSVTIGGVAATNVQVVDAVTLTATVPAHALGPVNIVVINGGAPITIKDAFSYLNAPPRHRPSHP